MARASEFRSLVARENQGRSGRGHRYSELLKRLAVEILRECEAEGMSRRAVSAELGVSDPSLARWAQSHREPDFVAVEVVPGVPESRSPTAVLTTASGHRVEGLSVVELGQLLRAIG